jgi:hypothetical protein
MLHLRRADQEQAPGDLLHRRQRDRAGHVKDRQCKCRERTRLTKTAKGEMGESEGAT